jgi:hypothetical protein
VTHFNGRSGNVSLQLIDITGAGGASRNSPDFTGTPTAPTPAQSNDSDRLATTAFVRRAIEDLVIEEIDRIVRVASRPPPNPRQGDLWWDSSKIPDGNGTLYIWYVDRDGGQWVDASPSIPGPPGPRTPLRMRVDNFLTPGTFEWERPSRRIFALFVEVMGGAGAGASVEAGAGQIQAGGGGGSGKYYRYFVPGERVRHDITVIVGAGGVGRDFEGNGGDGDPSIFGGWFIAGGGDGGAANGNGGLPGIGGWNGSDDFEGIEVLTEGQNGGGAGLVMLQPPAGAPTSAAVSGVGGFGSTGAQRIVLSGDSFTPGSGIRQGGAGAATNNDAGRQGLWINGGDGGNGFVNVTVYYFPRRRHHDEEEHEED